ncbi:MAG: RimK family alpha-L-glutamate ligase [Candidatus Thermochlorobacter sp.]
MPETSLAAARKQVHLAVAWDWEYDYDFIRILERQAKRLGVQFLDISAYNLESTLDALKSGALVIHALLDRASDTNELFFPLQQLLAERGASIINPYHISQRTMDKAFMHYELIRANVNVPYTIVLPAFDEARKLDNVLIKELTKLQTPFVLKPANGGGGEGVVKSVYSPYDASAWREIIPWDKYLAQEKIYPKYLYGWRCWFRAYYLFGEVEVLWWDDEQHLYRLLSEADKPRIKFDDMVKVMQRIAKVSEMDFFSSEIVLDTHDQLVVVDYVNDQIDLRIKSRHYNGLPDVFVEKVAEKLLRFAQAAAER